jgi:hypothetical protein
MTQIFSQQLFISNIYALGLRVKRTELAAHLEMQHTAPYTVQLSALSSIVNDCKYAQAPARAACCLVPGALLDTPLHTA